MTAIRKPEDIYREQMKDRELARLRAIAAAAEALWEAGAMGFSSGDWFNLSDEAWEAFNAAMRENRSDL